MNKIIANFDIIEHLQNYYRNPLPELSEKVKKDLAEYDHRQIRASKIGDNLLWETIEEVNEGYSDRQTEFFYDRRSGLLIVGVSWHHDFADALYSDLHPEWGDPYTAGWDPKMIDTVDWAMDQAKLFGFKSTVGQPFIRHRFSMNFKEKQYFKDFLPKEY